MSRDHVGNVARRTRSARTEHSASAIRSLRSLRPLDTTASSFSRPALLEENTVFDLSQSLLDQGSHAAHANSSAIPGNHACNAGPGDAFFWRADLPFTLPEQAILDHLTQQYFLSVNWFMHVIEEVTFRQTMAEHMSTASVPRSRRNFWILMSPIWDLGAHYLWTDTSVPYDRTYLATFRAQTFSYVESNVLSLLSYPDLESVQVGILLGSFHLFNGLPNLGFGILGSTIKSAQLIGLHRGFSKFSSDFQESNARSKVWWALEIFEKYAAIAFGRPCGIDDSDCEVPEITVAIGDTTLLAYHAQKCRLYRIVGTFLGRRGKTKTSGSLLDVHGKLRAWFSQIPDDLRTSSMAMNHSPPNLIQMQALALQLAYDNIQIVLHRQAVFGARSQDFANTHMHISTAQLRESALRTSLTPTDTVIVSVCRSSHAAMHVGICLFTAGVVLSAMYLTYKNTTEAQEMLTGLERITSYFKDFPGQHKDVSTQYLDVLQTLHQKCVRSAAVDHRSGGMQVSENSRSYLADSILESTGWTSEDIASFIDFKNTTSTDLLDYASGSSFQSVAQAWLWSNAGIEQSALQTDQQR